MEKPISFINKDGYRLYGILHEPDEKNTRKVGVICLNTGMQYRVIWHRLNVKFARMLCSQGYYVLRFDTHGIGDSEGEMEINSINTEDFHDAIQAGLFVPDTISAIEFFNSRVRLDKLFLIGPCGGALTSVITASRSKLVDGIIYMAGPVTISSSELTLDMHPRDAEKALKIRLRKAYDPRSFIRFLTGQSEYKVILKALKVKIRSVLNKKGLILEKEDELAEKNGFIFNRIFFEAFKKFTSRGGQILFLMPDNDRSSWGFRELFEKRFLTPGNPFEKSYQLHYVPKANHIYAPEESQKYVFKEITSWLEQKRA